MEQWSNLFTGTNEFSELSVRLLVLLVVLLIESKISISASYHPGSLWRFLALKMAKKTAKNSPKQQHLSGILSSVILLSIALVIVYAILSFALYPWFFETIFLLFALNSTVLLKHCKNIYRSLNNGKKNLAREQLNNICVRDTQSLSTMGVVKASIEGTISHFSLSYFTPIFIYLIAGPYLLTLYALTHGLAQHWSPKKQQFRFFGRFVTVISGTIALPFHCLLSVLIAINFGFKHLSIKRNAWHKFGFGSLLATTANAMNRELGGAVKYDGIKIRRPTLGSSHHPQVNDLKHLTRLIKRLRQSILIIITISTLFALLTI